MKSVFITFNCPCGKTVSVENYSEGSYNVGEMEKKSGWRFGTCQYTEKSIWLCPDCTKKAENLATELFKVVGSPYYYWTSLIGCSIVDEWCKKH